MTISKGGWGWISLNEVRSKGFDWWVRRRGGLGGLPTPVVVLCAKIPAALPLLCSIHFYPGDSLWSSFPGPHNTPLFVFPTQGGRRAIWERGVGLDKCPGRPPLRKVRPSLCFSFVTLSFVVGTCWVSVGEFKRIYILCDFVYPVSPASLYSSVGWVEHKPWNANSPHCLRLQPRLHSRT